MATKVKNLKGTTGKLCAPCGSWIDHWKDRTGSTRSNCGVRGCGKPATVGAHVKKTHGLAHGHHYIAPMCHSCNKAGRVLTLKVGVRVVSARAC
jgi:hypothetical protein